MAYSWVAKYLRKKEQNIQLSGLFGSSGFGSSGIYGITLFIVAGDFFVNMLKATFVAAPIYSL